MFTPAILVATGSSRSVTSRAQPPALFGSRGRIGEFEVGERCRHRFFWRGEQVRVLAFHGNVTRPRIDAPQVPESAPRFR